MDGSEVNIGSSGGGANGGAGGNFMEITVGNVCTVFNYTVFTQFSLGFYHGSHHYEP